MKKQFLIVTLFEVRNTSILVIILLLLSLTTLSGQWEQTNLSEGKYFIGGTSLGTKAYFAGGQLCGSSTFSKKVEIYNAATNTWDAHQELSVGRALIACAASESKVFFAGGAIFNWPASSILSEVDILDVITGEWTIEYLSEPRMTSAVSKGNIVLFAGGISEINPATKFSNVVDIYDADTGNWSTDTLSEARDARAAVVVGDLAIFAGGYNGQTVSNKVDIYHFSTGQWSTDTLSVPRGFMAATAIGTKAYFAGGVTNENLSSDIIDVYDSKTGEWSIEYLWFARSFLGNTNATTVYDKAFFINGGRCNLENVSWSCGFDVVDTYCAENGWGVFFLPRHTVNHTVVGIESEEIGQVLVAGGVPSCGTLVDKYVFSTTRNISTGKNELDFNISPNPATDKLSIQLDLKNSIDSKLFLYNMEGNIIHQIRFHQKVIHHNIDLTPYASGIYFLEISTDKNRVIEKVVVN